MLKQSGVCKAPGGRAGILGIRSCSGGAVMIPGRNRTWLPRSRKGQGRCRNIWVIIGVCMRARISKRATSRLT